MAVAHISIRGRVQGVGYRAWAADQARRCGLDGWVRNRRDGSVEAVFSGGDGEIAEMLAACRRGPALSRVDMIVELPLEDALSLCRAGEAFAVLETL